MAEPNGRRSILAAILVTLASASILGLGANQFSLANWQGRIDEAVKDSETMEQNVTAALTVLADHGTELQLIRAQIENLRGEVSATRTELLDVVRSAAEDRFRGSDWLREKEILNLKLKAIESQIRLLHGDTAIPGN